MNRIQQVDPCLDDAALLALAVGDSSESSDDARSHVRSCPDCQRRLKEVHFDIAPFWGSDARAANEDRTLLTPLKIHPNQQPVDRIGRFEVVEQLGRGGQAAVYLARHPTLKTDVVLKVGHLAVSTPEAEQEDYLVREAKLLSGLHHPNLGKVHDLEYVDDPRTKARVPMLVMEYVRGRPLRDVAKEGKFPPREAAMLIAKIARAAATAHAVGVFHRDITPGNIILDDRREPRLIDFGLARYRHAWGEHAEPIGPDYGSGTRGYRSPEQAEGRNDQIDARTDVYGLGAVLQFLLLGGKSSRTAWLDKDEDRERFGADITRLREAGVGSALCRVIEKAMQLDPDRRYSSATEFADALEKSVRSPRWPWYVAGAVVAAIAIVAIIWLLPKPLTPLGPQPVLVPQSGRLEENLPLYQTVKASLRVNVPRDAAAVLLQIDPDGSIEVHKDLVRGRQDRSSFDTMEYWPSGFNFGTNDGIHFVPDPAGTKVFLVVALNGKKIDDAEVQRLTDAVRAVTKPGWLASFAPGAKAYSRLWPTGVDGVRASLERTTSVAPPSEAQQQVDKELEKLRTVLRDGGWMNFAGVAVPYEPTSGGI